MHPKFAFVAVLITAGLACSSDLLTETPAFTSKLVSFTVDRSAYNTGDTVRMQLINTSAQTLGYTLCPLRVERYNSSNHTWSSTPPQSDVCAIPLLTLEPGDHVPFLLELPDVSSGTYRIVIPPIFDPDTNDFPTLSDSLATTTFVIHAIKYDTLATVASRNERE